MKNFSVTVTNSNGTSELKIAVDDAKQTGLLTYEKDDYPVSDCVHSSVTGGIIFLMHIGSIKLKARLYVQPHEGKNYIILITGNTPHTYVIPDEAYNNFKIFDQSLQLPVSNQVIEERTETGDWPDLAFDLQKVHLSLFLTWAPPGNNNTAEFLTITLNGQDMSLAQAYYMPAQNGVIVPLGVFDLNAEYLVAWKCRTNTGSGAQKTGVGFIKNTLMNTAKILVRKDNVGGYEEWTDAGSIKV